MSEDIIQKTAIDALRAQESTHSSSNNQRLTNTNIAVPNNNSNNTFLPAVDLILPPPPPNPGVLHPALLMNVIQQGLYRPGAPIHLDHRTRFDPGIQHHDILLPFHSDRHAIWAGNQHLKQIVMTSFHFGTSPQQVVAQVLQQVAHVRVFTLPQVDRLKNTVAASIETAALPYYLVPHKQATEELYKIILELVTGIRTKGTSQSVLDGEKSNEKLSAEEETAKHGGQQKVEQMEETTVESVPEKKQEGHIVEAGEKKKKKAEKAEKTSRSGAQLAITVPPLPEKTTTTLQPATNTKSVSKQKLIFKLKQSTIELQKPTIKTPIDLLELYSNPLFSMAFPEKPSKVRRLKPTNATSTTTNPPLVPSTATSTPQTQQVHQHALFHDDNENEHQNKHNPTTSRKRPITNRSTSTTIPRRESKRSKASPKRAKKSSHQQVPDTPQSIESYPANLPKGVTRRPSGKWVSQRNLLGLCLYAGERLLTSSALFFLSSSSLRFHFSFSASTSLLRWRQSLCRSVFELPSSEQCPRCIQEISEALQKRCDGWRTEPGKHSCIGRRSATLCRSGIGDP
jgi:hypothetical protein